MKQLTIGISIRLFTPGSGGLQQHAAALAQHLLSLGHKVTVVTRALTRTPSFQDYFYFSESNTRFVAGDVRVEVLGHSRFLNPAMWFSFKCVGRKNLRTLGIGLYNAIYASKVQSCLRDVDIIHHVGQGSEMIGFAANAAARHLGVPFVIEPTVHPGQWGDGPLDIAFYHQADRLLAHTHYEQQWLRSQGLMQPVDVVGCGIDDRSDGDGLRFRRRHGLIGPIVLFLGRKDADKGYPVVREAFSMVRPHAPETTLVCIGPRGSTRSRWDLPQDGILDLDYVDEATKHDALAACSVLCVPSEAESFGLVYMEAGRYGKPLIGRRLPVLEELLGHDQAALLVGTPTGQGNRIAVTTEELAAVLRRLLDEPALAATLGDNARTASARFLWPEVRTRFLSAYQLALTGKRN
jgi:glycosyltransferase involved in cell wall biosynthesis